VIEARGLLRLDPDGTRTWITEQVSPAGSAGDGLCVDADGRYYVAATADHGVRVLDRDGSQLDFLPIPGRGVTTNCCFGGDDGRTLFVTDGIPGQVLAWEGMPTPGLPPHPWPVADAAG
jgi:gluconolactonase